MNDFRIKVAGLVVSLSADYPPAESLYSDFRTDAKADVEINLTDEDLDFEYVSSRGSVIVKGFRVLHKISEAFIEYDVLLGHGAVIAHNGWAYMFSAASGTGKTTHIYKWLDHLPDSFIVNGDKPFLKIFDDIHPPLACGSPWAGKENGYTNTMVPLKAIICMERAEDNIIRQISFSEAFPFVYQQTYRPNDEKKLRKTLKLLQRLSDTVEFYHFKCNNFKDDCFDVAYQALVKERKG